MKAILRQDLPQRYQVHPRSLRFDPHALPKATAKHAQIAKDFGIHVGTLDKWLRQARIEDGEKPGMTRSDNDELRELRRRNRLLEQEVEVLRRAAAYLSQAHLPGKGSTRS